MKRWLPLGVLLVLAASCGGSASVFGVEIPDDVMSLDEAVDYVRRQERQNGEPLAKRDDVQVSFNLIQGTDVDVLVLTNTLSDSEFRSLRDEWAENLRELFDRWDICDLTIKWANAEHLSDVRPEEYDVTPGCE